MRTIERTIEVTTHGRYLVACAEGVSPKLAIVGFHGYAENAEMQMARLQSIAGYARYLLISIQGLHRFYGRNGNEVVASWMTSQDRELAIADNISYTGRVIESVLAEYTVRPRLLFAGFSQGVSMAFRTAVTSVGPLAVVAAGGDVPPEIQPEMLKRLSAAILCRGSSDSYYTHEKLRHDEARLIGGGVKVSVLEFEGGHVWPRELDEILPDFIREASAIHE